MTPVTATSVVTSPSSATYDVSRPKPSRDHLPGLDGLRGIAIVLVVLLHATESLNAVHAVPRPILGTTSVGFTGVDLFFVLSGFLITGILLDAKGDAGYFRTFYARRTLRIFPLYYAYLAIAFLLLPALPLALPAGYAELREHQAWFWSYLSNVLDARQGGWRIDGAVTSHFWSLAVEEQFYLVWPAVVYLLSLRTLRNTCIGIIVGAPLLRLALRLANVNPVAVYVLTICRADTLAIGAIIAVLVRQPTTREWLRRFALPSLVAAAVGLVGLGVWRRGFEQFDAVVGTLGYSVWAAFYGALLLVVVLVPPKARWIQRAAEAGWLRFFGKYSYAIYVLHRSLGGIAERVFPLEPMRHSIGAAASGLGFVGAIFLTSVIGAMASWHLLEKRFIALKRHFHYDRGAPPGARGNGEFGKQDGSPPSAARVAPIAIRE